MKPPEAERALPVLATVTCLRPCYAFRRVRGVMACVDCGNPKGSGHLVPQQPPQAYLDDDEYID